jgi:uncharacterized protein (DUF2147 family)
LFLLGAGAITAFGQSSIEGKWKDEEKGGTILIYKENGLYYGQLIAADDPDENAMIKDRKIMVIKDFQQEDDTTFCCGTLFQPKYKRELSGTLVLVNANQLKVKGKYGLYTGSRVWKRQ